MKGKSISNRRWFLAAAFLIGMLVLTQFAFGEDGEETQYFGALSLITPFIAIVLSFITKQVVLSLAAAVFAGATIINGGNIFEGFLRTCDTYFVGTVADSWNASLMLFILAVGGMIAVMSRMGGMQAMAVAMAKKAQGTKNVLIMTWILGLIIFFEDIANSLIVGPTMRPVADEAKVSREKLAYVIDSTAGPVTDMAPISSWVAHEIGMITLAFTSISMEAANVYGIFLQTIPYRFYNIFAIAMVIIVVLMQRDYGPMYKAEKRARLTGKLYADNAKPMMSKELDAMNVAEGAPLRIYNAAIPILVFIFVTVAALWYTGGGMDAGFTLEGIATAFGNTDAASSILYSVIFTSILCIIMAVAQKIMTLREAIDVWLGGCKELLFTITILMLAWSTGSVMSELGTGAYISGLVGTAIPALLLPALLFVIACVMAFSTGTSYGTSGIMIPIAFPIAVGMSGGEVGSLAIVTIAAVTCGAVCGDHCSPISDTTIMSSMGSAADLMDHVKTQIPYAMTVAVVAILGFILAAAGLSPLIILPLGIVALAVIVRLIGKSTKLEDLEKEGSESV